MAFPWNRGDAQNQTTPADARRRARGRRARQVEAKVEHSNLSREQRHQRVAWGVGAGLLILVLGIVAFGFYNEFYRPPRVWAGSVREQEFKMGDLVERIRVLQGLTGQVDLSTVPFEYLRDLINAEVLRQAAPSLGFDLSDEAIDQAVRSQFYPVVPDGQQSNPGQLEEEYQNSYNIFLARTSLTDKEFRDYRRRPRYRNRIDLFKTVFDRNFTLLARHLKRNELGESSDLLLQIQALCRYVEQESNQVEEPKDLRSKQVKQLEIRLRRLMESIKDLQAAAPYEYLDQFEVTVQTVAKLRKLLLTHLRTANQVYLSQKRLP